MIYDKPPFAIATTAKTGIAKPKDLEGKVLGAPAADGAFAQWKAFVKENGIDAAKVKIDNIGFPVREPMLADGKVDAITGFSFSMHFNLLQKGLKPDDIKMMLMADHGLVLYGNAIMVNPDYAKANPKVVAGFVRATIKGVLDTIKDPDAAIKSVMKRNDTGDEKIELDRLKMSLRDNFVTPWVKQQRLRRRRHGAAGQVDRPDRPDLRLQGAAEGRGHLHQRIPAAGRRAEAVTRCSTLSASLQAPCDAMLGRPGRCTPFRRHGQRRAMRLDPQRVSSGVCPTTLQRTRESTSMTASVDIDDVTLTYNGASGGVLALKGTTPQRPARRVRRGGRSVRLRQVVVDEARHRAGAARRRQTSRSSATRCAAR